MTQKLRALALVLGPVCLVFVSLWVGLGRNAAAAPSPFDTPPQGAEIILDQAGLGRVAFEQEMVFGPQCITASGDPFSPISSTLRPPGYYTNPQYSSDFYTYRYRIDVPADYAYDVVRVELFDPDTYNHSPGLVNVYTGNYVISHTLQAIAAGFPATETRTCNFGSFFEYRYQPCVLGTNEEEGLNPYWLVKIDEIRAGNGTSCGAPAGNDYNNGQPTQTAFDLYYYGQSITGTTQMNPLANYMGRTDNIYDTDLRWVSPGGAQSYDQPTFVPADSGSFEVDLTAIPNILVDPATGVRSLYLDVTTLAGASENGFEIWAGPPVYTGAQGTSSGHCTTSVPGQMAGVPSQVNKRNLFMTNCGRGSHASQGVTIYALDYAPTNVNTNNPVNIPVTYIGPEYAGQSIYVTLFDIDSGSTGPLVFYFDTLAFHLLNPVPNAPANPVNPTLTDFYRAFSVNNNQDNDPDLIPPQTRNCRIGNCNNMWITPSYRIDIPTLSPDCVDVQTTPLLCTPFYGGTLMARLIAGMLDNYVWHAELPELPPPDITQGCTGVFPVAGHEDLRSVDSSIYNQYVINGGANYPATVPTYAQLIEAGHIPNRSLRSQAQPGDTFLFIGQGTDWYEFSWLRWGSVSQPDDVTTLANSLTWPGDSFLFEEAGDPSDVTIHEWDWVALNSSSVYGTAAETQLKAHIDRGRTLRVVLFSGTNPDGTQIEQLANMRVLGYRLSPSSPSQRWLLLQFVSYAEQCGEIAPATINITAQVSVSETTSLVELPVNLGQAHPLTVTVEYATIPGTALPDTDYQPVTGTLTFAPGEISHLVSVPILDDATYEFDETFHVLLINPANGTVLNDEAVVTILNDDAPPELSFAAAAPTVSENVSSGVLSVTVQLAPTSGLTATVAYSTTDGTAIAGVDYQPVQGVITFTAGITSAVIPIPILNDTLAEGNEWFHLILIDPVNGVITGTNPAPIFIVDDECLYNLYAVPGQVEAENFTCGGEGVAYHDSTPTNEGDSAYRLLEGVDVWDDAAASQTHYVGSTEDGEWLVYTVEITATGRYDLWLAAASLQSGSCFRVEIDGNDVTGQVAVPVTGGEFGEVAAAERITLTAGTHQIRLAIPCGGADFDYLSFTPSPLDELYLPVMLKP